MEGGRNSKYRNPSDATLQRKEQRGRGQKKKKRASAVIDRDGSDAEIDAE